MKASKLSLAVGGLVLLAGWPAQAIVSRDSAACKLPAPPGVYLSPGFGYSLNCAPSTGSLNGFMFFVDFPDAASVETPRSLHDVLLPAAAQWYADASYGRLRLNITADTSRFYRMPARSDSYGWDRQLSFEDHGVYIRDALAAFTATTGRSVAATDVLYIVPTTNARIVSFSPTYMGDVRTAGGQFVARKAVTLGLDAFTTWGFKVLNHETGHALCLPDLYPLAPSSGPTGRFVGGWDMMGYISGPSPDYFAWNKWRLGWLSDAQIDCIASPGSTTHSIAPLEGVGGGDAVKAVVVRRNETAALVAEVRSRTGVDAAACATGVLLYTVSTTAATGQGSISVVDATPGSRGCAEDGLNDAPLSLRPGPSSLAVPGWGVTVVVLEQRGDTYTIRVDVR